MKKLSWELTGFLWLATAGLAFALDGTTLNIDPSVSRNIDSRHQTNLSPKYVHQPFSKKKKGTQSNQGKIKPLTQKPMPLTTPVPGRTQLLDPKGNPVTFWPAGQKKNYPTLYQDPSN